MRILVISWEYPPFVVGGMGKHVAELTAELSINKIDNEEIIIDILTTHYHGGLAVQPISGTLTVYRCQVPPTDPEDLYDTVVANNELLIQAAQQLAENGSYDLIHIHDWLVGEAGIRLKHAWKTPLLATIHATERGRHQGFISNEVSGRIDRMEWRICFEAWRVIVCSQHMSGELHHYFATPYDKIDVIANGIANPKTVGCAPGDEQELRQRYAPNQERLLFYVGRITYEKGAHVLLQAMPSILSRYPDVRLLVAGKNGYDLSSQARDLRIENYVKFLGYISDERRDCLYHIVHSAVFPSIYEPFGIVALEAMQQDCSVIASSVGGLGEVVRNQQNGLTVYPNDPQSIAWAVNELFTHPQEALIWRQQALQEVNALYRWPRIAKDTIDIYTKIVHERQNTLW